MHTKPAKKVQLIFLSRLKFRESRRLIPRADAPREGKKGLIELPNEREREKLIFMLERIWRQVKNSLFTRSLARPIKKRSEIKLNPDRDICPYHVHTSFKSCFQLNASECFGYDTHASQVIRVLALFASLREEFELTGEIFWTWERRKKEVENLRWKKRS